MRGWLARAVIVCAEMALNLSDRLKRIAKRMVANDLNRRQTRHRSDGR